MNFLRLVATGLAAGFAVSGTAWAEDQPAVAEGLEIVSTYCADCHAIGATDDSPFPPAPPFRELHLRYDVEFLAEALVEGIVTGHPDMPEFEFDPDQAEAIIAYLKSLE